MVLGLGWGGGVTKFICTTAPTSCYAVDGSGYGVGGGVITFICATAPTSCHAVDGSGYGVGVCNNVHMHNRT